MIQTDILIIGAGPCGLFTVFEAGLLKLRCHLIDALPQPGGQCSEIYPKKPIYDIPAYPSILAGDLVDQLMEQAEPFKPGFTLGERAEMIEKSQFCWDIDFRCVLVEFWGGFGKPKSSIFAFFRCFFEVIFEARFGRAKHRAKC